MGVTIKGVELSGLVAENVEPKEGFGGTAVKKNLVRNQHIIAKI